MREDLWKLLELAKHVASLAAVVHHRAMEEGSFNVDTKRSTCDLVTDIDRQAERELVSAIRAARPDDGIIGEEGQTLAVALVSVGFLIRWTELQTLFINILHMRWPSASKLANAG
jgi:fructose-1,6-bisphosphatase/inositol monophosphatase family enzyme